MLSLRSPGFSRVSRQDAIIVHEKHEKHERSKSIENSIIATVEFFVLFVPFVDDVVAPSKRLGRRNQDREVRDEAARQMERLRWKERHAA